MECDEAAVDFVGRRVSELMVKAANTLMPGILITAEPAAMYRWSKKAEAKYDENGKLIPCELAKQNN